MRLCRDRDVLSCCARWINERVDTSRGREGVAQWHRTRRSLLKKLLHREQNLCSGMLLMHRPTRFH